MVWFGWAYRQGVLSALVVVPEYLTLVWAEFWEMGKPLERVVPSSAPSRAPVGRMVLRDHSVRPGVLDVEVAKCALEVGKALELRPFEFWHPRVLIVPECAFHVRASAKLLLLLCVAWPLR